MIRVVLDTNVVVSGLLSPSGPPGRILELLAHRLMQVVYCDEIFIEYVEVLRRRELAVMPDAVGVLLGEIKNRGTNIAIAPWPLPAPDPSDLKFLATALAGEATLVTGNLRHYPPQIRLGVEVLSPRLFVDEHVANVVPFHKQLDDRR